MRYLAIGAMSVLLAAGAAAAQAPVPAVDLADIDTTCSPCENFYRFATGGWEARTEIPPSFSNWSSFSETADRNNVVVRRILDEAAANRASAADPDARRLGTFYATCMDTARTEAAGMDPIRPLLARIDAIQTREELVAELLRLHTEGTTQVFARFATQDDKNSERMILQINQGGLGLPDRDYYFKDDSATVAVREAYLDHAEAMLVLTGVAAAAAAQQAQAIYALEKALADSSLNRLELRDADASYNFMSVADANALTPGFSWDRYLAAHGISADSFNVAQPKFFRGFAHALATRPVDDWKAYLRFKVANGAAPWLSSPFADQAFAYASKLTGARQQQDRWRRCLNLADGLLSDALGKEYVKVAYTEEAKATMDDMMDNLFAVYRERIETLPWMGPETRKEALRKLDAFGRKIGYPDVWKTYDGMEIGDVVFYENLRAAGRFQDARGLARVGKPVDRGEWFQTAPTVNAYYSASNNEIGFPAGRLQPPFFHPSYDLGANYGGIGATIGHEVSHGFDDQGRKYDADGNLRDWWTADDARRFGEFAAMLERQYSEYTVLDSLPLNGKQTLGENIGDVSGVAIAYAALERALRGEPRTLIDGFTPEQRFFLGWAQARRQMFRDQSLRLQVLTGVHSPGEFRVNGPLSNMEEFARAFNCRLGDRMVRPPEQRVKIW